MSERIEFVGDPLPTGLPGFGGGTVSVLILPGFNTVVAVQQFGPVIEVVAGSGVTVPDNTAPVGSDPADPTDEVVTPGTAPAGSGASNNFCDKCVPPKASEPAGALLKAYHAPSSCTDCQGGNPGTIDWFRTAALNYNDGVFHIDGDNRSRLRGVGLGTEWNISSNPSVGLEIGTAGTEDGCALRKDKVYVGTTQYRPGAIIYDGDTSRTYQPEDLEVCNGGTTETWKVLAYKP